MSTQRTKADLEGSAPAEVDRIRDIIFGAQMRSYDQQFKRIVSQLEQLGKELQALRGDLDRQQADQQARTLKLQEEAQQRQIEMERTFANQLGQLQLKLDQQNADLTAQLREQASEMRRLTQDLRDEFARALDALEDDKASRGYVGDLLVEMGTRLKQQEGIAGLLGHLGKAAEEQPAG